METEVLKSQISSYFNGLERIIDQKADFLRKNQCFNTKLVNEMRDKYFSEIKKIEESNMECMEEIDVTNFENLVNDRLVNDMIFKRFCFIIELNQHEYKGIEDLNVAFGLIVVVDRYLSPEELDCYHKLCELANQMERVECFNSFFSFKPQVC
jgi:hypothetical protein